MNNEMSIKKFVLSDDRRNQKTEQHQRVNKINDKTVWIAREFIAH